jgi:uncharacterized lipoprotein (TIGR02269 family)
MKPRLLLLCCLLAAACASTNSLQQYWEDAEATAEECDAPSKDRCTLFLCGVEACALYFCEDVDPGRIVRAQAVAPVRPPVQGNARAYPTQTNPQRYWGSMEGLPEDAEPIFIIPWNETSEAYAARLRKELEDSPKRTWVKHHVFPRAFKDWFTFRGVDIHEWTLVLDKQVHENIHRGERGGPWNAEWRHFIRYNQLANRQDIHLFAVQMIFRFDLSGPVVPYYSRKPLPLFPVVEEDVY